MQWFTNIDWGSLFIPETPLLEIFIRGTIMYLGLFLMLRFVLKRESGAVGITDLLLIVLLADAAQNAMAGDYKSITDGFFLVAVLIFWAYFLDWLGYRFPQIQRLIHPPALLLVRNGQVLERNMRKEFVTREELESNMREQGITELAQVKEAYMEGDGKISIIKKDQSQHQAPESNAH